MSVSRIRNGKVTDLAFSSNQPETTPAPAAKPDDEAAITKRANACSAASEDGEPFSYAVLLDETHQRLFVSLWAWDRSPSSIWRSGTEIARWRVDAHPDEMALSRDGALLLHVANANHNTASGRPDPRPPVRSAENLGGGTFSGSTSWPDRKQLGLRLPDGEHTLRRQRQHQAGAVAVSEVEEPGKMPLARLYPGSVGIRLPVRMTPEWQTLAGCQRQRGLAPNRTRPWTGTGAAADLPPCSDIAIMAALCEAPFR